MCIKKMLSRFKLLHGGWHGYRVLTIVNYLSVNVVKSRVNDERPNGWAESQVVTNSSWGFSVCWRDE